MRTIRTKIISGYLLTCVAFDVCNMDKAQFLNELAEALAERIEANTMPIYNPRKGVSLGLHPGMFPAFSGSPPKQYGQWLIMMGKQKFTKPKKRRK